MDSRVTVWGPVRRVHRLPRTGLGRLLASGLAVVLAGTLADAVAASAAPLQPRQAATPATPLERADEAAALITARLTGKPVRVSGGTTETTLVTANPNGSVTVESAVLPQRARRADGSWAAIDLNLTPDSGGRLRPANSVADVRFSGGGEGPLVELVRDGKALTMSWPGRLPAPSVEGQAARYSEVLPGVDLVVRATDTGFTHVLVVKTAKAAANPALRRLRFDLAGSAKVSRQADGSLRAGANGAAIAWSQPATMWDSTAPMAYRNGGDVLTPSGRTAGALEPVEGAEASSPAGPGDGAHVATVETEITANGDLVLAPDARMLVGDKVAYPVFIDPSWSVSASRWAYATNNNETNDTTTARVGLNSATGALYRSFFEFPMTSGTVTLKGKYIQSATVQMNLDHSWSCTDTWTHLYRTPALNATPKASWSSMTLSKWLDSAASHANETGNSCAVQPDMLVNFTSSTLTADVQTAATNNWSTYTVGLCACNESGQYETSQDRWKKFYTNGGKLLVTYTSYPTVSARATVPSTQCVTGSNLPYINTKTPQLRAQITDPEGAQVKAEFEWLTGGGTRIGGTTVGTGASGSWLSTTVPSGAFGEGSTYSWRVRGNDGIVNGTWSSFCAVVIDTTAPSAAPSVSSSNYPEGQWAGGAGTAANFTFSASGVSDVASYQYDLDTNPPAQTVNAASLGAGASVSVPISNDGPHTLYVRSVDRAGNQSAIKSYAFNAGSAGITAPKTGDITAAKTAITATASSGITSVTYQWRRGDADAWVDIPASDVAKAAGGATVTWPLSSSGAGAFEKLNWDVAKTLNDAEAGADPLDGPVQLRGLFNSGAESSPITITFDKNTASAATTGLGPCTVNLVTGNCLLSGTDVSVSSYGSDLTVTRSFNSRRATETDSANMFGPGWVSAVLVEDADAPYTDLTRTGSLVQVGLPEGDTIGFAKKANISGGESFTPEIGMEGHELTYTSASNSYTLRDLDGNTVTFTQIAGADVGEYHPTAVTLPGSDQTATVSWEKVTAGGVDVVRPTRMLAPVPNGVNCSTMTRGCRALTFSYATATTATGGTEDGWGDYLGRVKEVSFTAWDPDATPAAMRTVVMARYTYDETGKLRAVWDPRRDWTDANGVHHHWERYSYNADGIITSVIPNGLEPWQLSYTTLPDDSGKGRLKAASRSALSAGTATTTVVYRVPVSGTGAPYDMSGAQTARWYQNEPPTDATAVFPAVQVPDGDQIAGTLPSSWERATVTYLDANARQVNTAEPGGHITTNWYDQWGNAIRTLAAGNRERALNVSATDSVSQEADLARDRSTMNIYSSQGQLSEAWGPGHDVMLSDGLVVRGRARTRNTYDEGAPTTGGPYDLVTTKVQELLVWDNTTGAWTAHDQSTTKTEYNWSLRQPTASTVDPTGLALKTRTRHDSVTGLVTSVTTPPGGTSDTTPFTRNTIYYRATSGSGYAECDLKPEWANLPCRTQHGGQPATGPELAVNVTTYDMFNQVRSVTEKTSAGTLRTTTTLYDSAARPHQTSVTAASSLGAAVPTKRNIYDRATGQITATQVIDANGDVTSQLIQEYDSLGRQTSYTDADANTATFTYNLMSMPQVMNDGKANRTYAYDGGSERRGLETRVEDAQAGVFTGSYDADGNLVSQTWPNGVVVTTDYDETGTPVGLTYTKPGCGQTDCTLYREGVVQSGHGQWRSRASTLSSQTYGYDQAGRLVTVEDTVEGQCTTRVYGFADPKSHNRTSLIEYSADPTSGGCQTTTATSTRTWAYDGADRLTTTGTAYDALGRTTTVSATDTVNAAGGDTTVTYHVTDLVKSINQAGRTTDYTLDADGRRIRSWTDDVTGAGVRATNHFAGDGDSPVWTQETATRYSRYINGMNGLAGIWDSDSGQITWQIGNLHGDVVATMETGGAGVSTTRETTEYGQMRESSQTGVTRYGWHGADQRSADAPSGLVLMGVRLYNPRVGRFLQVDGLYGGSAGPYDYADQDPINNKDLTGLCRSSGSSSSSRCTIPRWAGVGYTTWKTLSFKTLYTSRWYNGIWSYNWLGQIIDDYSWSVTLAGAKSRIRVQEETGLECRVTGRAGEGKFSVRTRKYKMLYWNIQNKVRFRYKFTQWYTPWITSWWQTYRRDFLGYYAYGSYRTY